MKRYEELAAGLGSLTLATAEPPPDLLPSLVSIPQQADRVAVVREHLMRNRKAYAGGLAVAAVGAAGAALLRSRARRVATA